MTAMYVAVVVHLLTQASNKPGSFSSPPQRPKPKINHDWPEFTGFAWGPSPRSLRVFLGLGRNFHNPNTSHLDEEVDFTNVHLLLMMKPLSFIASRIEKITNYYVWSSANLLDSWTLPTISLRRARFEDVGSRLLPRNKWDSFRDVQWIRV